MWMQELKKDCESFLIAQSARDKKPDEHADRMRLVDHLSGMPQRFQQELGFRQLTQLPPR